MTEYEVGSLGSLISGKSSNNSRTKIVFEQVSSQSKQESSSDLRLQKKGRLIKNKIENAVLKKQKPDIAGDNEGTVGKSWRHLPADSEGTMTRNVTESNGTKFAHNAARRIHIKNNTKKFVDGPERQARTIFVGNVPHAHAKKKKITKFFSQFGNVESVRFRCAPLKDPRMSKRVAVIKHEFHPERSSICAYVVFKSTDEAKSALQANGLVYHEHHLRVDLAGKPEKIEVDHKKSVFVGNVAFAAEEEDLWELFSKCGEIDSVRIVRDTITAVSKGIAFVNFKNSDAAELALQLDGEKLKKRALAVKRHRPCTKLVSEKVVRHKESEPHGVRREKENSKEELKLMKKEKRKMRREGEKMMGIVKKSKKEVLTELKTEPGESTCEKALVNLKFQGQTVEDAKKRKKKINKGELKKKKVAHLLGSVAQKMKKKL